MDARLARLDQRRLGTTPVELQVSADPDFLLHLLREVGCERRPLAFVCERDGKRARSQQARHSAARPASVHEQCNGREKIRDGIEGYAGRSCKRSERSEGQRFRGDLAVVERRLQMLSGADIRLSSEEHARYVTILPRLIASSDFSLPIIIFSSSGQQES